MTVVSPRATLKGELTSLEAIEVHGTLIGPVKTKGTLSILPTAHLSGQVHCANLACEGMASGKAQVSGLAAFGATAGWEGELQACRLSVRKGARMSGVVTRSDT
jgi:cytoskeletal protein CcmA (bactofilin family)